VKSRTNFELRQRSIEARLDPSWQPERAQPVLEGGDLHYEVSGRIQAISSGGLGLMQSVVEAVGLAESIDDRLHLLRRHLPYHESDHVLALVYNLLAGGRCLEDRIWSCAGRTRRFSTPWVRGGCRIRRRRGTSCAASSRAVWGR